MPSKDGGCYKAIIYFRLILILPFGLLQHKSISPSRTNASGSSLYLTLPDTKVALQAPQ